MQVNNIKEWMEIALKYGAVLENVELVEESGSFTVRAIEKEKESLMNISFPILLPEEAMEITEDLHRVRENYDIAPDLRGMLNGYLNFILSEKKLKQVKKLQQEFIQMPQELKKALMSFGLSPLFVSLTNKELKIRLIQARTIYMKGTRVLMPFIDFMNHSDADGIGFNVQDNAVIIRGNASSSGELFAMYNRMLDPFAYLHTYLFVPVVENALSMNVAIRLDEKMQLSIGRGYEKVQLQKTGLTKQEFCVSEDAITIPYMWMGSTSIPRNPFWSFKKLWEEKLHRTDTQRTYSIIKSLNITKNVSILRLCDSADKSQAISMVRECALQNIKLIGEGFEEPLPKHLLAINTISEK